MSVTMGDWRGENGDKKYAKKRRCMYEDMNAAVWDWFCDARSRNIRISGVMIQEKAVLLSMSFGYNDFTGLNGWLDGWKARHNIRCSVLNGESADVPEDAVRDWGKRLPVLCDGYEARNIFNADETGLFFRALPSKSMVTKGDSCNGGKNSKDRITVLLAPSATGEKLRPLVTGKSENLGVSMGLRYLRWV